MENVVDVVEKGLKNAQLRRNKMKVNTQIEKGMKVTYKTDFSEEKEILKSLSGNEHTFVVYNCNNNWNNYEDYTVQRTRLSDLQKGW